MDKPPSVLLGNPSVMSAVTAVANAAVDLVDFLCLQQAHPIITGTEAESVK